MDLAKHTRLQLLGCIILASLVALTLADTPPGIAKNPSHATCKIKKYKHCYNLKHVCPKFCPDSCHVECASCKPICGPSSPSDGGADGGGDGGNGGDGGDGGNGGDGGYTPPTPLPPVSPPPTTPPSSPSGGGGGDGGNGGDAGDGGDGGDAGNGGNGGSSGDGGDGGNGGNGGDGGDAGNGGNGGTAGDGGDGGNGGNGGNGGDGGDNSGYTPPTPLPPVSPPPPTSPTPSVPSPPDVTPTPPYSPPATPTPSVPAPSTPTPPGSPPYTPPQSDGEAGVKRARCKKKGSPCYGVEYTCPAACPRSCQVDCVTCKPLCNCDKPGSVCQDPRFIGGDGLTFYFHGKKDSNFCLLSDPNLHINAHFIGKRSSGMARDFTWVQSIGILFGTHRLYVGALKTATWVDSVDRISVSFDGNVISLPLLDGAMWTSSPGVYPFVSVKRVNADTNNVQVEVEGLLKITARVVPITMEDSRIHGYEVKEDDCLAHLDLGFKFLDLGDNVDGVLGQTYRSNYVSRVKIGLHMPVMGGDREFQTTGLFVPDCSAAKFTGNGGSNGGLSRFELPEMSCASAVAGKGVVCKR